MPDDFRDIQIQEGLSNYVTIGTTIFLSLAGLFIFFILFSVQRKRKMLQKQKEREAEYTRSLLETQIEIQEQTLKTISQEIHDNVGQVLSLAKLNLNTLEFDTGASRQEKIDKSIELVSKAISDLRDLSRSFHDEKIEELALSDALEHELKIISNTGLFKTAFTVNGTAYPLQNQTKIILFRIVQESLSNAIKYSKAESISIKLDYASDSFSVSIADDGKGFDVTQLEANETGIGLKNMKNRAKMINAELQIESAPGKGTNVFIRTTEKNA